MLTSRPLRSRPLLLVLCLAALPSLLVGVQALGQGVGETPLDQFPPPGPVEDSVQQVYRGSHLAAEGGGGADLYYFTGNQQDQINKINGNPSATFGTEEPEGSSSIIQAADSFSTINDEPQVADPFSAYWTGDFSGDLDHEVDISTWWSSANATSFIIAQQFQIAVWADPDLDAGGPQTDKLLGTADVGIQAGAQPTLNVNSIQLTGPVTGTLHIQMRPLYIDGGHELRVSYGSSATPSGFAVPTGPPPEEIANEEITDYEGDLLELQQAYVGRQAAEPTVGVLSDGTAVYAAGAFDALPGQSPAQLARTEVLRSRDQGKTWESIQPMLPGGVTSDPPTTLDPYVYVDETTDRIFNPELYLGCTNLHYSDDGGDTWQTNRVACGKFVNDHHTIYAGPPPDGLETDGYPNVLYYCFNRVIDSNCGRSLDGGASWEGVEGDLTGDVVLEPAYPGFDPENGGLCGGLHGHIQTDSEGRLFVPKGHCGYPFVAISEDGAETWERVRITDQVPSGGLGGHVHLAVAIDAADNVYFVWYDTELLLPWLSVSKDHGRTWSKPLMIAPPGVKEVQFPALDAGPEGVIALSFPGVLDDDPERASVREWHSYVVMSTNADEPDPLFFSATGNPLRDPIHRGNCSTASRCGGMYDFLDVLVAHDAIWATTSDGCTDLNNKCVTEEEAASTRGHGIALRQIGGPSVVQPPQPTDSPSPTGSATTSPGGTPNPTATVGASGGTTTAGDGDGTPETGGGLAVAGVIALAAAVAARRQRRR